VLSKGSQGEKIIIFVSNNYCIGTTSHFPHLFLYKVLATVQEKGLESQ